MYHRLPPPAKSYITGLPTNSPSLPFNKIRKPMDMTSSTGRRSQPNLTGYVIALNTDSTTTMSPSMIQQPLLLLHLQMQHRFHRAPPSRRLHQPFHLHPRPLVSNHSRAWVHHPFLHLHKLGGSHSTTIFLRSVSCACTYACPICWCPSTN